MSFYSQAELRELGFAHLGDHVLISKKASIYGAQNISIGSHVRIDDFCILSGTITIGSYVHISAYTSLFAGSYGIELCDFATVSSRCAIYAISDDYSGEGMANPMVPDKYRLVQGAKVLLKKHVLVGTNSTILPGVILEEGASIGACSLITKDCEAWSVYVGIPVRKLKERSKRILDLEKEMEEERQHETIS